MTIQYVNTGSGANAGDGDSLRTAFYKINNNFAELSSLSNTDTSVIIINSFPPTTSTEGTIWYDTVSGRNFIYYDGFWVDAAPPAVEPISFTTVTSHILPGADLTYDLGSTSSQWRSLYVGSSTINNFTVTNAAIIGGILNIDRGIHEKFTTSTSIITTTTYDCSSTQLFYHVTTGSVANWTANFTNLSLESERATTVSIIINQGSTGYYPSAVQISGVEQTLNWRGNTTPTVSSNRNDVVTFSILNNSGSYLVLGQLTGF